MGGQGLFCDYMRWAVRQGFGQLYASRIEHRVLSESKPSSTVWLSAGLIGFEIGDDDGKPLVK